MLGTEVDPVVRQTAHAVFEPVAARRGEIQHADVQRDDVRPIIERQPVQQPVGLGLFGRHAHDLYTRQCQARAGRAFREPQRVEQVESAGPAEGDPPVAQTKVRQGVELLALQAALAMIRFDFAGLGVVTHQARRTAKPDAPGRIRYHAEDGVARQPVLPREGLEAKGLRLGRRSHDSRQPTSVGRYPDAVLGVDGQTVDGVGRQPRRAVGLATKHGHDSPVGTGEIETATVRTDP